MAIYKKKSGNVLNAPRIVILVNIDRDTLVHSRVSQTPLTKHCQE